MKINKTTSEQYNWGADCIGWHLVKSEGLSVIEEAMPEGSEEVYHFHNFSQQFFYILSGRANFEIEKDGEIEVHEIRAGEGIHVLPGVKHKIKNTYPVILEFIVISQPTTRGDRIEEPFPANDKVNLHNKKFKLFSMGGTGEVNSDTVFHYRQKNEIVWATYEGGAVLFGTLSGAFKNGKLKFHYQHQNTNGDFMTGHCESIPEFRNGCIFLNEKWQWTSGDQSKGESVLMEIID